MPYYLLRLHAPRPEFPHDMTEAERAAMGLHAAYWQELADAGTALAVGPVMDPTGAWGLAIVSTETQETALELGLADPVIGADLGFSWAVFPFGGMILPKG